MSEHTPGPWEASLTGGRERAVFKVGDAAGQICKLPGALWGPSGEEKEANAKLIAAAPEMLRALKHARDNCLKHPDQLIDQAIAKAEGDNA